MDQEQSRFRLPDSLDVDSLRGCVDAALRLFGLDAAAKFGPSMERAHGSNWVDRVVRNHRSVAACDPSFWISELRNPGSPARATPALQNPPSTFRSRLARAAEVRNAHCHFLDGADQPTEVIVRLQTLSAAAGELRLRCEREIRAAADDLARLHSGTAPAVSSLGAAVALAAENVELIARCERAEVRAAEEAERADRAAELLVSLEERDAVRTAETQAEIAAATAEVERTRQEAEIAERHRAELEAYQAEVDVAQAAHPELPPTVGEVLAHVYAAGIGALRAVDEAVKECPWAIQVTPNDRQTADEVGPMYASILDGLGVSRRHVEAMPGEPRLDAVWAVEHVAAAEALMGTSGWINELADLDEQSRIAAQELATLGIRNRQVAINSLTILEAVDSSAVQTPAHSPAAREIADGTHISPGEPWPYERGEEAWVLSAQRRTMRLARRSGPRLCERLGDAGEEQVVAAFLKVRPAGGRVFVDADGDAATFVDGELIYLGQLPA